MRHDEMKQLAFEANKELPELGLVLYTWGNVSLIDRETNLVAIKPSGVEYDTMKPEDIVIVDLDGKKIDGDLNPSSDLMTHLVLYRAYPEIGGVVHTHSTHATAWAQARRDIPCLGTTHADYFYGAVPCTRDMLPEEIADRYEERTGDVIVETFTKRYLSAAQIPGVLVGGHGPFSWGKDAKEAVHNAAVLEEVARMALYARQILGNAPLSPIPSALLNKHFLRKHGKDAYYGQKK